MHEKRIKLHYYERLLQNPAHVLIADSNKVAETIQQLRKELGLAR